MKDLSYKSYRSLPFSPDYQLRFLPKMEARRALLVASAHSFKMVQLVLNLGPAGNRQATGGHVMYSTSTLSEHALHSTVLYGGLYSIHVIYAISCTSILYIYSCLYLKFTHVHSSEAHSDFKNTCLYS